MGLGFNKIYEMDRARTEELSKANAEKPKESSTDKKVKKKKK